VEGNSNERLTLVGQTDVRLNVRAIYPFEDDPSHNSLPIDCNQHKVRLHHGASESFTRDGKSHPVLSAAVVGASTQGLPRSAGNTERQVQSKGRQGCWNTRSYGAYSMGLKLSGKKSGRKKWAGRMNTPSAKPAGYRMCILSNRKNAASDGCGDYQPNHT